MVVRTENRLRASQLPLGIMHGQELEWGRKGDAQTRRARRVYGCGNHVSIVDAMGWSHWRLAEDGRMCPLNLSTQSCGRVTMR